MANQPPAIGCEALPVLSPVAAKTIEAPIRPSFDQFSANNDGHISYFKVYLKVVLQIINIWNWLQIDQMSGKKVPSAVLWSTFLPLIWSFLGQFQIFENWQNHH